MQAGQEITLGQFVKQIAALLQQRKVQLPFKNQTPWHLLFYELTKLPASSGKPRFLDDLRFDWDAPYPKSQELAEFLNALHFTASVSARNPHFDVISVAPEVADRWAQSATRDNPNVKEFVERAAALAEKEFNASLG